MSLPVRFAVAAAALALSLAAVSQSPRTPRKTPVTQAEVDRITREAILIDTHDDITSKTVNGYDIATPNKTGQTDLPRMKGFLGAEFFAVYVGANYVTDNSSAHRALDMIDTVRTDVIMKHPDEFVFATTADDIERAHHDKKIAALMGIEGGHAIEDDLRALRDFYALGVRYMTLTHFNTNHWADSQGDVDDAKVTHHNGLTPFGEDVVREMNRLGRSDLLRRSEGEHGAPHRLALGLPRGFKLHAQHERRHDQGACSQGRHHADQLWLRFPVAALL